MEFLQGDLLEPFGNRRAHYLVCNPPYISQKEYQELDREVKAFEPRQALLGGPTGLEFYERLAKEMPKGLIKAWFEIGHTQGSALFAALSKRASEARLGRKRALFCLFP